MIARHDWLDRAHAALRAAGLRTGGGREQVMSELAEHGCLLGAYEIAERLRVRGRPVSLPTVYRTLDTLLGLGLVVRVDAGEGIARYEPDLPEAAAHHHSVCDRCGKVLAFSDDELETAIATVSDRLPFDVQRHDLVLHGACAECARDES